MLIALVVVVMVVAPEVWFDSSDVETLECSGFDFDGYRSVGMNSFDTEWTSGFSTELFAFRAFNEYFHTWLPIKVFPSVIFTHEIAVDIIALL